MRNAVLVVVLAGAACIPAQVARSQDAWRGEAPPQAVELAAAPAAPPLPGTDEKEPRPPEDDFARAWGVLGLRGYAFGDRVAPNGVEFNPLFSLDLDFNTWLWRRENLYLFFGTRFWGQRAGQGVTNPSQGAFDFSKRELDFAAGAAWTYCGRWEARVFAYSQNNLNRGDSVVSPSGFSDGVGLENRYYLADEHLVLGRRYYDPTRDPFVSVGFYPTKDMIDLDGERFKPSLFARAYLTYDLFKDWCYLYLDAQLLAERPARAKLVTLDAGAAVRPLSGLPDLEFRVGSEDAYDFSAHEWDTRLYFAVRLIF
jgi:hypothetical protein